MLFNSSNGSFSSENDDNLLVLCVLQLFCISLWNYCAHHFVLGTSRMAEGNKKTGKTKTGNNSLIRIQFQLNLCIGRRNVGEEPKSTFGEQMIYNDHAIESNIYFTQFNKTTH